MVAVVTVAAEAVTVAAVAVAVEVAAVAVAAVAVAVKAAVVVALNSRKHTKAIYNTKAYIRSEIASRRA